MNTTPPTTPEPDDAQPLDSDIFEQDEGWGDYTDYDDMGYYE